MLLPVQAHACPGCMIIPSSSRFNLLGWLFWLSLIYWGIMLISTAVRQGQRGLSPEGDCPLWGTKLVVGCVLLAPFTMMMSVIALPIFTCVLQAVRIIVNRSNYTNPSWAVRLITAFQWVVLVTFVVIYIVKPGGALLPLTIGH